LNVESDEIWIGLLLKNKIF